MASLCLLQNYDDIASLCYYIYLPQQKNLSDRGEVD